MGIARSLWTVYRNQSGTVKFNAETLIRIVINSFYYSFDEDEEPFCIVQHRIMIDSSLPIYVLFEQIIEELSE